MPGVRRACRAGHRRDVARGGNSSHRRSGTMHVLVTGGAGYIGCRLVPALLERGHPVTVVDKLYFGDGGLDPVKDRIRLFTADVRDIPDPAFDGVDAIVHLAGLSNDPTAE